MDVTANQSVMVGCDEAEVNDGHYTGIGKSESRLPSESSNLQPIFLCERWNDTVHAQVLELAVRSGR
jgi:hypothetical protein